MNDNGQKQIIEVTGDLVLDNNLARLPTESCTYSNPVQAASRKLRLGGAWYLADLIKLSCSDLRNYELSPLPDFVKENSDDYARAHSIWAAFPEQQGQKKKYVWRIREFLGCQKPDAIQEENKTDVEHPKLIVIDDMNLGFREARNRWPASIENLSQDQDLKIVLKHSPTLTSGGLWQHLVKHFADRLTVVVSLNALRDRHAVISKGVSWDQTIEDLIKEFREGVSAHDLGKARNVIVHIPNAGVACFSRCGTSQVIELKHLVFDPSHMEDDWNSLYPGKTFGATSVLTAVMVRHLYEPGSYPFFIAASRALSSIRKNHALGAGTYNPQNSSHPFDDFNTDAAHDEIKAILHPDENSKSISAENGYAAVLVDPQRYGLNCHLEAGKCNGHANDDSECKIDLLQDVAGYDKGFLAAKAFEVVRDGIDEALRCVPKAKYGNFVTVDREEIERINELRGQITAYCSNAADRKPLSIAVFGPPGSGKSFAIKQLARQLFPNNRAELEFNLSQFSDQHELNEAFHQVHNATVRGEIPFVFWDEFDTDKLKWLKSFLAPMQDAVFRDAGIEHPFGKAIFIFAGGTCRNFEQFSRSKQTEEEQKQFLVNYNATFKDLKGPDFVSRLRGYLNVKGPNQIQDDDGNCTEKSGYIYLIRRAMLLRSLLERNASEIIDPQTKMASISTGILNAFIHVDEYLHGARSMESIITMGSLLGKNYFGPDSLPSPRLLALHVTDDFMQCISEGEQQKLPADILERLAKAGYDGWREATGRNENTEYEQQTEEEKMSSREPVPRRIIALAEEGYIPELTSDSHVQDEILKFDEDHDLLERLMQQEHNVWLRGHLVNGWELADTRKDKLRLHRDIRKFKELPDEQQNINRAIIQKTIEALHDAGYLLKKK